MPYSVKIEVINNGYLVTYGKDRRTSYQVSSNNNQVPMMIKAILDHFQEKEFRLVTHEEAVKMQKKT